MGNSTESRPAQQCRAESELYRFGRNVVQTRQCRRKTTHESGLCHQHRSDAEPERAE